MGVLAGMFILADDYEEELDDLQDQIDVVQADLGSGVPRGLIGYAEQTSDQLIANSSSEFASTALAFNVAASRQVRIDWCGRIQSSDAGDTIVIRIRDEDTGDELKATEATLETAGGFAPGSMFRVLAGEFTGLAAGLHTFQIYVSRPSGTGTGGYKASSDDPGAFLVTDLGPG